MRCTRVSPVRVFGWFSLYFFFGFLVWWVFVGLYWVLFWVSLVYPLYTFCVLRGALRFLYKTLLIKKKFCSDFYLPL